MECKAVVPTGPLLLHFGGVMTKPVAADSEGSSAVFDLLALAGDFPESAETMLIDTRLTEEVAASARLFRIYTAVPAHYHATCDEYLLVVKGRARVEVEGLEPQELGPGKLLFFRRGVVHGFPEILEEPLVVFSVDTPWRDPADVHFVDAGAGTPQSFLRTIPRY
jgi:mannose-6-phosphate isomerase-like protein (cupin superfamily)